MKKRHFFLPGPLNLGQAGSLEMALVRARLHGMYVPTRRSIFPKNDGLFRLRITVNGRGGAKLDTQLAVHRSMVNDAFDMVANWQGDQWRKRRSNIFWRDAVDLVALDKGTLRIIRKALPDDREVNVKMTTPYTARTCDFRQNGEMQREDRWNVLRANVSATMIPDHLSDEDVALMAAEDFEGANYPQEVYVLERGSSFLDVDVSGMFKHRADWMHVYCDELVLPDQADSLAARRGRVDSILEDPSNKAMVTYVPDNLVYVPLRGGLVYNAKFDLVVDTDPNDEVPFVCTEGTLYFHIRPCCQQ